MIELSRALTESTPPKGVYTLIDKHSPLHIGSRRQSQLPAPPARYAGCLSVTIRLVTRSRGQPKNLGPIMVYLFARCVPNCGSGESPYRIVSMRYRRMSDFHGGKTGFQRKGLIPDWCAVSYLLKKSLFAVAREKTILIGSERLGKGQGQSR
jgi:hypothetical protein